MLKEIYRFNKTFYPADSTNRINPLQDTTSSQISLLKESAELCSALASRFHVQASAAAEERELETSRLLLRFQLIFEEIGEVASAVVDKDPVNLAQELIDLCYVTIGSLSHLGFTEYEAQGMFEEVHRANMSKLDNKGEPIHDSAGRVVKSGNFKAADINGVISGVWSTDGK